MTAKSKVFTEAKSNFRKVREVKTICFLNSDFM